MIKYGECLCPGFSTSTVTYSKTQQLSYVSQQNTKESREFTANPSSLFAMKSAILGIISSQYYTFFITQDNITVPFHSFKVRNTHNFGEILEGVTFGDGLRF